MVIYLKNHYIKIMKYKTYYESPIGKLLIISDGENLNALRVENDSLWDYYSKKDLILKNDLKIFKKTKNLLDQYFKGESITSNLAITIESTDFRKKVFEELMKIPYGETITYKEIADKLNTSARSIGGAVANNPILIFIPCHRVIGSDGKLTGFSAGVENKKKLLELEKK